MRVTQQDIARIANVSQATVSRVLAGDEKVEPSIRERVLETMRRQNYQVDARARSLRSKRAGLIGLVVNRPRGGLNGDPFFASLTSEIVEFLRERPYHLCLEIAAGESSQSAIYDEMLRTRRVDGLILVESEARDERIYRLQQDSFPFVLIGNPLDAHRVHSVDNDNVLAAQMATRHLIESDFRRIGFIAGTRGLTVSEDRIAGYCRAIDGHQTEPLIWHSKFGLESAGETAKQALSGEHRPDALVVLDDFMALGVAVAARKLGLRIPSDLGLVSFNDTNLCELVEGGLSSVSLNIPRIVQIACGRLLRVIEDEIDSDPKRVIIPCELKVRGSSRREVRT